MPHRLRNSMGCKGCATYRVQARHCTAAQRSVVQPCDTVAARPRDSSTSADVVAHGRTARCNDIIFSLMQKQHLKSVKKHFSKTLP